MNNQILLKLKTKLEEVKASESVSVEIQRNVLKEELQFYVLNFIYHHPEYSKWVMYGGSALRICHGLDRMSVDLDFEIEKEITLKFLEKLKSEIESYFSNQFKTDSKFMTVKISGNRGLRLNFHIGEELGLGHASDQVHLKIDLNNFKAEKATVERIPINRDQLSFVIRTYNMSNLMASKIAAIYLRKERSIGKNTYSEKGRDIYDLLWYMNKKTTPDLDYLKAKGVDVSNLQKLFDGLTIRMNEVNEDNLKQDLTPLFTDKFFISNWLENWLESYLTLVKSYPIHHVKELESIEIKSDFFTDNYSFSYKYHTEEDKIVWFIVSISDHWIQFADGDISTKITREVIKKLTESDQSEKIKQYATLFHNKIEKYLSKSNREVVGDRFSTKLVRLTAKDLIRAEQIVLTKSALINCEFDDLLK